MYALRFDMNIADLQEHYGEPYHGAYYVQKLSGMVENNPPKRIKQINSQYDPPQRPAPRGISFAPPLPHNNQTIQHNSRFQNAIRKYSQKIFGTLKE